MKKPFALLFTVLCGISLSITASEEGASETEDLLHETQTVFKELETVIQKSEPGFEQETIDLAKKEAALLKRIRLLNSKKDLTEDNLKLLKALEYPLSIALISLLQIDMPKNYVATDSEAMLCKFKKIVQQYTSAPNGILTTDEIIGLKTALLFATENPFDCLVGGCNCSETYRLEKTPYKQFLSFVDQLQPTQ